MSQNLKELYANAKRRRAQWQPAIDAIITDAHSRDDVIEIGHAAKLVVQLDEKAKLIEKRERPDFIAEVQGRQVGIEHSIIVNQNTKKYHGALDELFRKAGETFAAQYQNLKIRVEFRLSKLYTFRPSEKPALIQQIIDYVHAVVTGVNAIKPDFILPINPTPHTMTVFNYNPGVFTQGILPDQLVANRIIEKEKKIASYRERTGLAEQWLLIVINSTDASSYDLEDYQSKGSFQTPFNRIYLMEELTERYIQIV